MRSPYSAAPTQGHAWSGPTEPSSPRSGEPVRSLLGPLPTGRAELMTSLGAESGSFNELINANGTGFITSCGGTEIIGTPEQVAEQIKDFYDVGVTGLAMVFTDFAEEIPYFAAEVLPR